MLCRFVNHDEMNLFLITFLQSLANLLSISVMSKLMSLANFRTAVAHVVNLGGSTVPTPKTPSSLVHY